MNRPPHGIPAPGTPRIGLIGTGPWARMTHAPAIAAHDGVSFSGIWGRDAARSRSMAAEFAVTAYDTAEALFSACDVIAFAVAPGAQVALAPTAARAGCDLLLEKPLAPTAADGRALAQTIGAAGVHAAVFHTFTYLPEITARIDALRAQSDVVSAEYVCRSGALTSGAYTGSAWRQATSGALLDIGPHALSVLERLLGPAVDIGGSRLARARAEVDILHEGGTRSRVRIDLAATENRTQLITRTADGGETAHDLAAKTATAYGNALDLILARSSAETERQLTTALRYVRLLERAARTA